MFEVGDIVRVIQQAGCSEIPRNDICYIEKTAGNIYLVQSITYPNMPSYWHSFEKLKSHIMKTPKGNQPLKEKLNA